MRYADVASTSLLGLRVAVTLFAVLFEHVGVFVVDRWVFRPFFWTLYTRRGLGVVLELLL